MQSTAIWAALDYITYDCMRRRHLSYSPYTRQSTAPSWGKQSSRHSLTTSMAPLYPGKLRSLSKPWSMWS